MHCLDFSFRVSNNFSAYIWPPKFSLGFSSSQNSISVGLIFLVVYSWPVAFGCGPFSSSLVKTMVTDLFELLYQLDI